MVVVLVVVVVMVVAAAADVHNRYELRMTTEHIEREVPFVTRCSMRSIASNAMACVSTLVLTRTRGRAWTISTCPPWTSSALLKWRPCFGAWTTSASTSLQAPTPVPPQTCLFVRNFQLLFTRRKRPPPHSTAAPAGKKVYIHCKAGRGRSASLACCYLIASGEHARAAADLSRCAQVVPASAIARDA